MKQPAKRLAVWLGALLGFCLLALGCGVLGNSCADASDNVLDAAMDTIDAMDGE